MFLNIILFEYLELMKYKNLNNYIFEWNIIIIVI